MAKVTIEFDSAEDAEELKITMNAVKWYSVVHELYQRLNYMYKNEDLEYAQYIRITDALNEIMNQNEVSL